MPTNLQRIKITTQRNLMRHLKKALNAAKEVLENQDATQKDVNHAKVALLDAQGKLVEKTDVNASKRCDWQSGKC